MRFLVLAAALLAAAPLVSKVIATGPAGRSRELDATRHDSSSFSWKSIQEILLCAYRGVGEHRTSLLAAGVAFYALFAIFPALGAATWIFGLLAEPATIHGQLDSMKDVLPAEAWQIIDRQVAALTANSTSLSVAGIFSLLVALYSARTAASAMMEALNTVYGVPEERSFVVTNGIAILFTLMGIAVMLIAVAVMIVLPILFNFVGLSSAFAEVIRYARWPALAVLTALALAVTYRFGPNRVNAAGSGSPGDREPRRCFGSSLPSASPGTSPPSIPTTRSTARSERWSFSCFGSGSPASAGFSARSLIMPSSEEPAFRPPDPKSRPSLASTANLTNGFEQN